MDLQGVLIGWAHVRSRVFAINSDKDTQAVIVAAGSVHAVASFRPQTT